MANRLQIGSIHDPEHKRRVIEAYIAERPSMEHYRCIRSRRWWLVMEKLKDCLAALKALFVERR